MMEEVLQEILVMEDKEVVVLMAILPDSVAVAVAVLMIFLEALVDSAAAAAVLVPTSAL